MSFEDILKWATGIGLGMLPFILGACTLYFTARRADREAQDKPASIGTGGIIAVGGAIASQDATVQVIEAIGKLSACVAELVREMQKLNAPTTSIQAIEQSTKECRAILEEIHEVVKVEGHEARIEREVQRRQREVRRDG